jgi:hypothetical protein
MANHADVVNSLYIVLRHRGNRHENWKDNDWADDDHIRSITTTPKVAAQCQEADIVYVHRCGWKNILPSICCVAKVERIAGSKKKPQVFFKDVRTVGLPTEKRPYGRMNSYHHPVPA